MMKILSWLVLTAVCCIATGYLVYIRCQTKMVQTLVKNRIKYDDLERQLTSMEDSRNFYKYCFEELQKDYASVTEKYKKALEDHDKCITAIKKAVDEIHGVVCKKFLETKQYYEGLLEEARRYYDEQTVINESK